MASPGTGRAAVLVPGGGFTLLLTDEPTVVALRRAVPAGWRDC